MLWLIPPTPSTDLNYNVPFSGLTQSEEDAGLLQDVTVARAGMRQAVREWKQQVLATERWRWPLGNPLSRSSWRVSGRGGNLSKRVSEKMDDSGDSLVLSEGDGDVLLPLRQAHEQLERYREPMERLFVRLSDPAWREYVSTSAVAAREFRFEYKSGLARRRERQVEHVFRFEVVCVLFTLALCKLNLGSALLQAAADVEEGSEAGATACMRKQNEAAQWYRESSGIFHFLSTRMCAGLLVDVESERVLCELHPLVSLALSHTALGLAYWVAVQRAEAQQLSPLALSRLCLGAAETLRSAAAQWAPVLHEPVSAMVQGVQLNSPPTSACYAAVELLQALCRARALYYRTVHLRAHETGGKGMRGMCVRLTESAAEALAPDRLASWLRDGGDALPISSGLQSSLTAWRQRIDELRQRCWRDNDMVFMESVPPSLPDWTDADVAYPFERPPFVFPSATAAAQSVVVSGVVATGQAVEHTVPSLQAMTATGSAKARR